MPERPAGSAHLTFPIARYQYCLTLVFVGHSMYNNRLYKTGNRLNKFLYNTYIGQSGVLSEGQNN